MLYLGKVFSHLPAGALPCLPGQFHATEPLLSCLISLFSTRSGVIFFPPIFPNASKKTCTCTNSRSIISLPPLRFYFIIFVFSFYLLFWSAILSHPLHPLHSPSHNGHCSTSPRPKKYKPLPRLPQVLRILWPCFFSYPLPVRPSMYIVLGRRHVHSPYSPRNI